MPFLSVDGTRLYYRLEGREDQPVLVFSHSLGCDHGQWDPQVPGLLQRFRVLRYDLRGHGASDVAFGDYTIKRLARDVVDLTAALGIERFAFCGLSLGGMLGQWLGANAPERLTNLVLANTSPKMANPVAMEERRLLVLSRGMPAIADAVLGRFFSDAMRAARDPWVSTIRTTLLATDPVGYAGCCAAVRDLDQVDLLPRIPVRTLVIGSDTDQSTPWAGHGEVLAQSIPGAAALRLPTAHLSNLEEPGRFTNALLDFVV